LRPRRGRGVFGGAYAGHSQGKLFFAEGAYGGGAWYERVRDQLEYNGGDNPYVEEIVPVVLRAQLPEEVVYDDETGEYDGVYVTRDILIQDSVEFYDPRDREWYLLDVESWGAQDPMDGVEEDAEGFFRTFGVADAGGFKPSSLAEWEAP